jgi:hypothetical protein
MLVLKKDTKNGVLAIVLLNFLFLLVSELQVFSLLALPIIILHKDGRLKINIKTRNKANTAYSAWRKYFFYIYYPLHLSIIYIVKIFILKI